MQGWSACKFGASPDWEIDVKEHEVARGWPAISHTVYDHRYFQAEMPEPVLLQ